MKMEDDIKEIRQYCLDRLDEIDRLNESHTLSAFSCYAWLIGVLSHIAYAGQVSRNPKLREDGVCFKRFVGSFMPDYDSNVLYENFRCGLIHAYSLDPTWKGDEDDDVPVKSTKLFLTHDERFRKNGKLKEIQLNGVKSVVIYYKDLSSSIRDAIEKMFEQKEICESAKKATAHQRLVVGLLKVPPQIKRKFQLPAQAEHVETAQLSGFYTEPHNYAVSYSSQMTHNI